LIHCCEDSVGNNEKVTLRIADPSDFGRLWSPTQIRIKKIGWMPLIAYILKNTSFVCKHKRTERKLHVLTDLSMTGD